MVAPICVLVVKATGIETQLCGFVSRHNKPIEVLPRCKMFDEYQKLFVFG